MENRDQPSVQSRGHGSLSHIHNATIVFSSSITTTTIEETRHRGVCVVLRGSNSSFTPLPLASGAFFKVGSVVRANKSQQRTKQRILRSPRTMKTITTKKRITQSQTTDLTRFGLNAYVLGAIYGENFI